MNKKSLQILIPVIAAIVLGTAFSFVLRHYITATNEGTPSSANTQALFAASFVDAEGKMQAVKQWQGKTLIVNFWATWCPPCREEMPELSHMADVYKDRNVVILGISTDDIKKMQDYSRASPTSYPLLAGDLAAMTLSEQLGNTKSALPYTVILRPDGTIANTYFGRVNQALLEKTLLPVLDTVKSSP